MSGEAYDPVANPYAPGAGTPPPSLVGRDAVIDGARTALRRLRAGRSAQHLMLTGLRGVGKTVLLGALASIGEAEGFRVVRQESLAGDDTVTSLLRQMQRLTDDLGGGARVARALRSIDSVSLTVLGSGGSLARSDVRPDREALSDVVVDVVAAASEHDLGVVLAIDEAHTLGPDDLRRILAGVHRCAQDGLPLWCVLAGLPNLVGVVAKAATYAERLFTVEPLGPLGPDHAIEAVTAPAIDMGVAWAPDAAEAIADLSDGYPFFVQAWAFHTWNAARDEPISQADVERGGPATRLSLDTSFFAARIARIPDSEVGYVRQLASLGAGPHRSGEVAAVGGRSTSEVSALRDRLIKEGVVYAPRYGWVEFAIPHFDDYVRRTLPPP